MCACTHARACAHTHTHTHTRTHTQICKVDIFIQEDGNAMHCWNTGNKLSISTAQHHMRLKAPKGAKISQKSSYSQHSLQLVEKQKCNGPLCKFMVHTELPGFTSAGYRIFWRIFFLDHTGPSKSPDHSLILPEGQVLSTVLMKDFTSQCSDIRYCALNRHICIILRSTVEFEVGL